MRGNERDEVEPNRRRALCSARPCECSAKPASCTTLYRPTPQFYSSSREPQNLNTSTRFPCTPSPSGKSHPFRKAIALFGRENTENEGWWKGEPRRDKSGRGKVACSQAERPTETPSSTKCPEKGEGRPPSCAPPRRLLPPSRSLYHTRFLIQDALHGPSRSAP